MNEYSTREMKAAGSIAPRILVTGASGFVGTALLRTLAAKGLYSRALYRRERVRSSGEIDSITNFDLTKPDNMADSLAGIDCIIHCAARVHVMNEAADDPLDEFRAVNVEGTLNLARAAASHGVRRFIFLSSVKVHGEASREGAPFSEVDDCCPSDHYGRSKLEAEIALRSLAEQTGMQVIIIRCPLVYGPGVKGNFQALLRLADSPWPLPLGGINNARSLLFVDNLVDFLIRVIEEPQAVNETFLLDDGRDLSTSELVSEIRTSLRRQRRLWRMPQWLVWAVASCLGKRAVAARLFGSLQVDAGKARQSLGWTPPFSVSEGLSLTVAAEHRRNDYIDQV